MSKANRLRPRKHKDLRGGRGAAKGYRADEQVTAAVLGTAKGDVELAEWMTEPSKLPKRPPGQK